MHTKHARSLALIAARLLQCSLNELSFEGADSLVESNSFLDHLGHQRCQLFFHKLPLSNVLAPPFLHRAISVKEARLEIRGRGQRNNTGARQEIRRQL